MRSAGVEIVDSALSVNSSALARIWASLSADVLAFDPHRRSRRILREFNAFGCSGPFEDNPADAARRVAERLIHASDWSLYARGLVTVSDSAGSADRAWNQRPFNLQHSVAISFSTQIDVHLWVSVKAFERMVTEVGDEIMDLIAAELAELDHLGFGQSLTREDRILRVLERALRRAVRVRIKRRTEAPLCSSGLTFRDQLLGFAIRTGCPPPTSMARFDAHLADAVQAGEFDGSEDFRPTGHTSGRAWPHRWVAARRCPSHRVNRRHGHGVRDAIGSVLFVRGAGPRGPVDLAGNRRFALDAGVRMDRWDGRDRHQTGMMGLHG